MQIPSKLQSGQNFKQSTVRTVNSIIDYLKTQRIVGDGKTIRVNQFTSGIGLSAIPQGGAGKSSAGGTFDFPFKLSVTSDQNGQDQVSVTLGIIYFQGGNEGEYLGIAYQAMQNFPEVPPYIPMDWESVQDGFYSIVAVACSTVDDQGNQIKNGCCLVTKADDAQIPSCAGFNTFALGTVQKQTVQNQQGEQSKTYTLTVSEQGIIGDVIIDDSHTTEPFAIRFYIDYGDQGTLKTFEDFTISLVKVNSGMIYYGDQALMLEDENDFFTLEYGQYYCYIQDNKIYWTNDIESLQLSANCYLLCGFTYEGYISYQQFIRGDLVFKGIQSHPFRLYVDVDQEGNQILNMENGDVYLQSTSTELIRFYGEDLKAIDYSSLADGFYLVFGAVQSKSDGSIDGKLFLATQQVTTADIPSLSGYFAFPIGAIEVYTTQTLEGDFIHNLAVFSQYQDSIVIIDNRYFDLPFCARVFIDHGSQTEVKQGADSWQITGAKVNYGVIYDKNVPDSSYQGSMVVTVADQNNYVPSDGVNYCYLEVKKNTQTGLKDYCIKWTQQEIQPSFEFEGENIILEKYVLSVVTVGDVIDIENCHPSDFVFEKPDTYKVKTNDDKYKPTSLQDDLKPGFLIDKLYSEHRKIGTQGKTWEQITGKTEGGYIFIELMKQGDENGSQLWFRWDYPNIQGWGETYLTLNCKDKNPVFQPMGWIRIDQDDTSPSFLPDKVTAKEPIKVQAKQGKLEFSIDMSKFVGNITVAQDSCFTIEDKSTDPVNNGKEFEIKLDQDCLFNKLKITGENPIIVTGGGKEWKISFDDDDFIKSISGGECIKAHKNGNNVSLSLDMDCLSENLISITGTEPISVTKQGKNFNISIDESKLGGGNFQAGDCIKIEDGQEGKIIAVDKECVFTGLKISGDEYITVQGQGQQWNLALNTEVFGKVKVSAEDTLGYLGEKIVSTNFIVAQNYGNSIGFQIGEDAIQCGDDSLEVYVTNGFATINSRGKVRVDADGDLGYLHDKIQSSDQSLVLQTTNDTVDLWINKQHFTSSDESILIQRGDTLDFKATGKVKVSENDTADYLGTKIVVDSSIASLIALQDTGTQLKIKSAIEGSGIMLINNGQISLLQAPTGKAVLVAEGGSLSWKQFGTCQDSCQG